MGAPTGTPTARLSLRVDLANGAAVGPGKVRLLELVRDTGSIAEAARAMGMSYRRAWLLVDEVNRSLESPAVAGSAGGRRGGGARLTPAGERLVALYRAVEAAAAAAAVPELDALDGMAAAGFRAGAPEDIG